MVPSPVLGHPLCDADARIASTLIMPPAAVFAALMRRETQPLGG
jgi:hypothetical protein